MEYTTALELVASLSEEGFSLDELVYRAKELFEREGISGWVSVLLSLTDEVVSLSLVQGRRVLGIADCCEQPHYHLHRREKKTFRSSVGEIDIRWRRLRCSGCGKTMIPLRAFLGLERWQSKTVELERIVAEVVSEQSYRRSVAHLDVIGMIPVPRSTAHRWVMDSDCDRPAEEQSVQVLFADGTGYKRRPLPEQGLDNKGEVRVLLGLTKKGQVRPLGAWSGLSWAEIEEQMWERLKEPAQLLMMDGEPGLAEGLAGLAEEPQRCHWHMIHDLDRPMWRDGVTKGQRRAYQKELAGILGIALPEADFHKVSDQDREALERKTSEAECKIQELISELDQRGYVQAVTYLRNAQRHLFGYVRFWLRSGLVSPRAVSVLERMMREIGRRLKRMAYGWSQRGAAKMARIIIRRVLSPEEWIAYWEERLRINNNVHLLFRGITVI